ncbi:Undecaprenyl-phosphate N-acetylglucosaminyl 1-phosphate transferase [Actinidia chinensis var. chinensis]|uniref:Undecaprenyl-phosphate N-acetylglucosaminyl 1-phosphate transferase n=1 Tax=Actinidia chinensis var. chinensis TaxID=1590841 RepID=A0A2R6R3I7_ACTCC|nr:Undecaprenyl-phosphate N-acetylglucosaminyl 1-phosphate transferase [Actinidia chinensis var. chinensis]
MTSKSWYILVKSVVCISSIVFLSLVAPYKQLGESNWVLPMAIYSLRIHLILEDILFLVIRCLKNETAIQPWFKCHMPHPMIIFYLVFFYPERGKMQHFAALSWKLYR